MDKQTFINKAALMQPRYMPNQAAKQRLAQVDLIAAVGPTGVGKSAIMERSGIPYVTSDVTRSPRKGEDNGIDYNFRNDYDELMRELEQGEFVQYIIYQTGEFYGTKAASYPESGPCTMAIIAEAIPHFISLGFRQVLPVYIIPPSYDVWMKRIGSQRNKDLAQRLIEAKVSIEDALADSRYHFMINNDLLSACKIFHDIAHGQMTDTAAQGQAREVALRLLAAIDTGQ